MAIMGIDARHKRKLARTHFCAAVPAILLSVIRRYGCLSIKTYRVVSSKSGGVFEFSKRLISKSTPQIEISAILMSKTTRSFVPLQLCQ